MADDKPKVAYVDEDGKTKERDPIEQDETENVEDLKPLGTDPQALSGGKPEFMTHKDALKAEKDGTTI